jgi:hypothetical protein
MNELKDKAIAAYEASELKKEDEKKNQQAIEAIRFVLSSFGYETTVSSDVFLVENLLFAAEDFFSGQHRQTAYKVTVYRLCSKCSKAVELELGTYISLYGKPDFRGKKVDEFGQWLALRHNGCKLQIEPADFTPSQTSESVS